MLKRVFAMVLVAAVLGVAGGGGASGAPLTVIENVGQFDPEARYQIPVAGGTLWVAPGALWMTVLEQGSSPGRHLPSENPDAWHRSREVRIAFAADEAQGRAGVALRLSFPGARALPRMEPFGRLATKLSYLQGKDPAQWHPDVPVWSGVRYVDLFPGVDLEISGAGGALAPRFVVKNAPAAGVLATLRLRVEGATGLEVVSGHLRCATAAGSVDFPLFEVAFSAGAVAEGPGEESHGALAPRVEGHEVRCPFGSPKAENAGSPTAAEDLLYGTYLGGPDDDYDNAIAVDGSGNAFVTGCTYSAPFPTTPGAFSTSLNGFSDAFVAKINATGSALIYGTYLGGESDEYGNAIAVNASGEAYVTGETDSSEFPVTDGVFQPNPGGGGAFGGDVFVAKLNSTGTALIYGTYLGGEDNDYGYAIAVDGTGNAFVAGYTESENFPVVGGVAPHALQGAVDGFVAKLNPSASTLLYSTYLGGAGSDFCNAIALDGSGNAFVTGRTDSENFPVTPEALQSHLGGYDDAFVAKLNAAGSALEYGTYLGGGNTDEGYAVAVNGSGHAFVTGLTGGEGFPVTLGAFQTAFRGDRDAFVVALNAQGKALLYGTFLGGTLFDRGTSIVLDTEGRALVTGMTRSTNFPTSAGGYQLVSGGNDDAFVARFNAGGTALDYGSYLGGTQDDYGNALTRDGAGNVLVTGQTESANFPVTEGAFQKNFAGAFGKWDAFVVKLRSGTPPILPISCRAQLQGHGAGGHAASLRVRLRPVAGGNETELSVASNADGTFSVTPSAGGEWRVLVKERRTLAAVRTGTPGGPLVDFGALPQGDANNDNKVTILDFSILATTFGKSAGGPGYDDRGDFNGDAKISILDFSLLATDFGRTGDALSAGEGSSTSGQPGISETAGNAAANSGEGPGCQMVPGPGVMLLALPLGLLFGRPRRRGAAPR